MKLYLNQAVVVDGGRNAQVTKITGDEGNQSAQVRYDDGSHEWCHVSVLEEANADE